MHVTFGLSFLCVCVCVCGAENETKIILNECYVIHTIYTEYNLYSTIFRCIYKRLKHSCKMHHDFFDMLSARMNFLLVKIV